ncbi:hypothetical protein [Nocardia sp. NPDC020380]|uniref:hypothetical protein n=1 Tax=Nocardia sp. NPDC020380 TaxID=3364309 RepID=UPI0037968DF3
MATTGTQDGDTTVTVTEPALVTRLVAPLLELRASLGDGARPDGSAFDALAAAGTSTRNSDDPHRAGAQALTDAGTALAAVSAINRTRTQVAGLADVSDQLAPILSDAYDTRDRAAQSLDVLIADFRSKATNLVQNARSQADLDPILAMAADYIRDGVGVVKQADGEMDAHTAKVQQISDDSPQLTIPPAVQNGVDPNAAAPASNTDGSPQNSQYPNPGQTSPDTNNDGWNNNSSWNNNGWNNNGGWNNGWNNNGGWNNGWDSGQNSGVNYMNSPLARTDPQLAAQLTLQQALIAGGVTLGSGLISAGVTIGGNLVDKVGEVVTHVIDKGAEIGEKGIDTLAGKGADQLQQAINPNANPAAPGAANPAAPNNNNLFPGLAPAAPSGGDPNAAAPAAPDTSTIIGGAPSHPNTVAPSVPDTNDGGAPAAQPQAGVPADPNAGSPGGVVPPVTAKPQPDTDKTTPRRDGQAGVTPQPAN